MSFDEPMQEKYLHSVVCIVVTFLTASAQVKSLSLAIVLSMLG